LKELERSFVSQEGQDDKEKAPFIDTLFQYISRNSEIAHFVLVGENYNGEEIIKQNRHVKAGKTTIIDFPDLTEEEATTYLSSLVTNASPEDIKLAISKLGGRTSDLQSLVARIKMGNTLVEALNELTTQAEQVIRTEGFGGKYLGASTKKWSQVHLWKAAKKIVQNSSPAYDDILFSAFSGDNEALKALLKNNILRVQKKSGIKVVTAFSPLYLTAFQKMVNETPQLKKALDLLEKKADIAKDMEELAKVEEELIKLHDTQVGSTVPDSVKKRRDQLYEKLAYINTRIEKKERDYRENRIILGNYRPSSYLHINQDGFS